MVAAEARASGIAVIAPDGGGAAEHAAPRRAIYRAADPHDAARAIVALARSGERVPHGPVRSMDEHFAELMAHYAALTIGTRAAA